MSWRLQNQRNLRHVEIKSRQVVELSIENLLGVVRKIQGRRGNFGFFQAVEDLVQYMIVVPHTIVRSSLLSYAWW